MSAQPSRWTAVRAVIAVTALYALALQAVLGGMLPIGADPSLHRICLQGVDAELDGPAESLPAQSHPTCCTAAHAQPAFDAPNPLVIPIVWPVHHAIDLTWRPEVVSIPRAPPRLQAAARAPPVV